MSPAEIVALVEPLAATADGLGLLLLVGSQARGDAHPGSDVDLAYLAQDSFDPLAFVGEVVRALGTDQVDLVDLSRANALFRFEAAREGTQICGSDDDHLAFRLAALRFWFDAGHIIDAGYEETLAALG